MPSDRTRPIPRHEPYDQRTDDRNRDHCIAKRMLRGADRGERDALVEGQVRDECDCTDEELGNSERNAAEPDREHSDEGIALIHRSGNRIDVLATERC